VSKAMLLGIVLIFHVLMGPTRGSLKCPDPQTHPHEFHLVRECQRASVDDAIALENVSSLEDCANLAIELRGLALNYAPGGPKRSENLFKTKISLNNTEREKHRRSRLTVFQQPGEFFNCHVLQCPQNTSFAGMVNDSRFDYYSLYGRPTVVQNYNCVPEVGLFVMFTQPSSYLNASLTCTNATEFVGSLAHIASEFRSRFLAQWLLEFNRKLGKLPPEPNVFLAYVGLAYNRSAALNPLDFRNAQGESLDCFLYRAWEVGHPRLSPELANASCVALTVQGTWQTLNCDRELPFICEIHAAKSGKSLESELDIGPNAVFECSNESR
ncbi:hypothetical protein KR018_003886, partial [Drosophila ironensis]